MQSGTSRQLGHSGSSSISVRDHWIEDRPWQALAAWKLACWQHESAQRPHLDYGNVLRDLNRFEEAEAAYRLALGFARGDFERACIHWNLSQVLIGLERYEQAYAIAESRFGLDFYPFWRQAPYFGFTATVPDPARARATLPGRHVTVWSEQGIGDTLQYLRWIPLLIGQRARVRLEVEPPLLHLLREGLAWLGADLSVVVKGVSPRPLEPDCQGSLLSLPWLLGQAPLSSVFTDTRGRSARRVVSGYLCSPHWPCADPSRRRRPRVGLVWASGRKQEDPFLLREYQRRCLPPEVLVALLAGLEAAEAELVCLQYGPDRQRASSWTGRFAATLDDGISLADTARWIAGLDLVISVDTATAHLVGAMARPGWVLLPWGSDPRWLRQRQDSPWYPSLTLLRQPAHADWDGLVGLVLQRFRDWRRQWARL